jgi:hypothetical protein
MRFSVDESILDGRRRQGRDGDRADDNRRDDGSTEGPDPRAINRATLAVEEIFTLPPL